MTSYAHNNMARFRMADLAERSHISGSRAILDLLTSLALRARSAIVQPCLEAPSAIVRARASERVARASEREAREKRASDFEKV